ncbi:MAG: lytic transglycosylase domain-containing protein [Bacteroidota bacterium]
MRHLAGHLTVMEGLVPAQVSFAGGSVPVDMPDVRKRLERELNQHMKFPAGIGLTIKRANRYQKQFLRILRAKGIPEDFFYMAVAESGLANVGSHRGAKGFWQFMEATAEQYGLEVSSTVDERFHPEKSTYAACRYLNTHYKQFGDWALVAASYNMGGAGLARNLEDQQVDNYFDLELNPETHRYLFRILSYKCLVEDPARFELSVDPKDLYEPIRYSTVRVSENIDDLSTFAKAHGSSYLMVKTLNPWLTADHLEVKPGKTYEIRLPLAEELMANELIVEDFLNPEKVNAEPVSLDSHSDTEGVNKATTDA